MKLAISSLRDPQGLGGSLRSASFLFNPIFRISRFSSGHIPQKSCEPSDSEIWRARGFTLVEMTVVIAVILVLVGVASLGIKPYYAYRDGRSAGESLRAVKAAQLMYLSDNPSTVLTSLTSAQVQALLLPYMPGGYWPILPQVNGVSPTIICNQFPPIVSIPDPSGSTTDGLWDVGLY